MIGYFLRLSCRCWFVHPGPGPTLATCCRFDLILPPRDHFSGLNATAGDAFADPNPNMRPIGSKSRNEVLGARVVLYMAAKKWDMAPPFHRSHGPELLLRGNLLLAFIPFPFFARSHPQMREISDRVCNNPFQASESTPEKNIPKPPYLSASLNWACRPNPDKRQREVLKSSMQRSLCSQVPDDNKCSSDEPSQSQLPLPK